MSVIELEPTIDEEIDQEQDHDDVHECHLYLDGWTTLCGLPSSQDWHAGRHTPKRWHKGLTSCPDCGAPICVECLLVAS